MTAPSSTYGPHGPVFQIVPGVQSYDWGKLGKESSVAQFAEATDTLNFQTQTDKPYAELWMGTHPTLPSRVIPPTAKGEGELETLAAHLQRYPDLVGQSVVQHFAAGSAKDGEKQKWSGELPFLFKILSIGKALSIQAHPDKKLARQLHHDKPDMYKDDNHKPEMALALTNFKGFCGFRPLQQIAQHLETVPEFRQIIAPKQDLLDALASKSIDADQTKSLLQKIFAALMKADESKVKEAVEALVQRYHSALQGDKGSLEVDDELAALVCTLHDQFPADVGVLCAFVLNVVHLSPGQAIFLQANEPHAYLDGEIVECMAASDNVVRAGLTPKARDVQVLVDMLTYEDTPSDQKRMQPEPFAPAASSASAPLYKDGKSDQIPSWLYDPPIEEFSVVRTHLDGGTAETHRAIQGPSLLIVTSTGAGAQLTVQDEQASQSTFALDRPGQVFFIGAGAKVTLQAADGADALITYRAFVEAS